MPITLIQLISEQTIQNLLPILRLKPAGLIHLVTPKTAARSAHLLDAAHAAGIDPRLSVVQLSAMPGIPESFNAVTDCLNQMVESGTAPVINFTGGTKLMSIGAYAAALQHKTPSLYVDTQDACFVDGGTSSEMGRLLNNDWSFTPIRNQLRVDTLAIAGGIQRVTGGRDWRPFLPLADHLLRQIDDELNVHAAIHGPVGIVPQGREPRTPRDWLPLFDEPLSLPEQVARLGIDAGLLRTGANGAAFLPDGSRSELEILANNRVDQFNARYFRAIAPIQQAVGFLSGGWWEVIVAHALDKSGLVRDLRWSVQVGDRTGADLEEDIVALDGVELVYISCKRGGAKARLLPQLEETRARAASLGGAFNRRFLAVRQSPSVKVAENLRTRAAQLGIRIITGANVYQPGIFAR